MPTLDSYLTDTLMRDLVGHDRRPVSFLVYLWLSAEQQRREEAVQISYQELAECIGVSKSSAQSAVGWLVRRRLLAATKQNATATPVTKSSAPGQTALVVAPSPNVMHAELRQTLIHEAKNFANGFQYLVFHPSLRLAQSPSGKPV